MSEPARPITVTIMDKEYLISCSEDEREQLHTAAELLNQKMQELKRGGKIIGTERIAVMTALNIAHELQACREQTQNFSVSVDSTIRRLQSKIDQALTNPPQMEM